MSFKSGCVEVEPSGKIVADAVLFARYVLTEQETGVEREYASELTCDGFVEGLVCGREVATMEPPDA